MNRRRRLRVASFNLHQFVGSDGRRDPVRSREAVAALEADLVAVQEFRGTRPGDAGHGLERWGRELGMRPIAGFTLRDGDGDYGNALFTRLPIGAVRRHDIARAKREPRGVLDVEIEWEDLRLRVLTTHLGLAWRERDWQIRRLARLIGSPPSQPTVLLADTNDWSPGSWQIRRLRPLLPRLTRARTFPARRPMLRLDRIAASAHLELDEEPPLLALEHAHASDHRPLVARLSAPAAEGAGPRRRDGREDAPD